jgi:flagellar assembly protein FliH
MARAMVIKADSAGRTEPLGLRAFRMDDVLREAQLRLDAAKAQADQIVRDAEADAVRQRETGRQDGYGAGHEEGMRKGQESGRAEALAAAKKEFAAQQASLISTCQLLVEAIQTDRAAWQASARQDLIDLALAIARRIAHHVGDRERDVVLANLEEAVRLAGARSDVTILVNPKDAETARVFAESLLELKEQWSGVRVVEEPEVSAGGCRVQWGSGAIDATLETQLDRIAEALGQSEETRKS